MLGVWNKWKRAFCVVDAGTALTLDFVSEDGTHLGGYILPGLKTMVGALVGSTALISDYRDAAQQTSISPGRNTNEAVCRGALISLVGGIERAKKEVFQGKHEKSVLCVIGGGDSRTLIDHLDGGWLLSEQLVLDGLSAHIMTIKRKTK
jgi:type III pantothenate kinase